MVEGEGRERGRGAREGHEKGEREEEGYYGTEEPLYRRGRARVVEGNALFPLGQTVGEWLWLASWRRLGLTATSFYFLSEFHV